MRRASLSVALIVAATVLTAPQAQAAPVCAGAGHAPVLVADVGEPIEGAIVDGQGRMYVTVTASNRVLRIDAPGAPPVPVASVPGPGALAIAADGSLLVGYGTDASVLVGDSARPGKIGRIDVATGALTPLASGLSAANGMAVASDGTIYATNDFGQLVGRVLPNGVVQPEWARVPSANGAVLDANYLYVARTFVNPGVTRIPLANPGAPESMVNFGPIDSPDGLTLDGRGRPVVPLNVPGQVVRVDPGGVCQLVGGLMFTSAVTYGHGSGGFSAGRLFAVGFTGTVHEIIGG